MTGNGSKPYKSAAGGNRFRFQASRPLIDVNENQPHSQTSPVFDPSLLAPSKNPQVNHSCSPSSSHDNDSNVNPSQHNSGDPFENDVLNDIGRFYYFDKFLTLFSDVDEQSPDEDECNAEQALKRSTKRKVLHMEDGWYYFLKPISNLIFHPR